MTNAANLAAVASTTYGYANATKLQSGGVTTNALAWVNFGYVASAITVRASYNVSSVTRNSQGNYTLNFSTATTDANYCISGIGDNSNGITPTFVCLVNGGTATTSAIQFTTGGTGSNYDCTRVNVSVFGN